MNKRVSYTALGFGLFMLGSVTLLLNVVGLDLGFLSFLEIFGRLGSFLIKLSLILAGILVVAFANADETQYDEYFDGKKGD